MYCPNCGLQNELEINFCRACGTNLSLVSQALTSQPGQLAKQKTWLDSEQSVRIYWLKCLQVGFFISMFGTLLVHFGMWLGLLMVIPGVICLGKGLAGMFGRIEHQDENSQRPNNELSVRNTGELNPPSSSITLPPPSVTEITTRH